MNLKLDDYVTNHFLFIYPTVAVPASLEINPTEKMILLYHDLKDHVSQEEFSAVDGMCPELPDISSIKIPFLQKKKEEKISLLRQLVASVATNPDANGRIGAKAIIAVGFQRMIENYYFEKIHWTTRIRKIAGNFSFCRNLFDLQTEPYY